MSQASRLRKYLSKVTRRRAMTYGEMLASAIVETERLPKTAVPVIVQALHRLGATTGDLGLSARLQTPAPPDEARDFLEGCRTEPDGVWSVFQEAFGAPTAPIGSEQVAFREQVITSIVLNSALGEKGGARGQ